MGNCQAADAATIVIQHPDGKVEKVYWSLRASQVMANNPGHYVAIVITTPTNNSAQGAVKHLKLLRPDDCLHIGHVYRLVSFEDVLREFVSKKHVKLSRLVLKQHKEKNKAKYRRPVSSCSFVGRSSVSSPVPLKDADGIVTRVNQPPLTTSNEQRQEVEDEKKRDTELDEVVQKIISFGNTKSRAFGGGAATTLTRHGQWRPVLQSISEVGS